jgi:hypothetical protein
VVEDRSGAALVALVAEAAKKSSVSWLTVGDERARAVWHGWSGDAAYVVTGGIEQSVPGLADASSALLTLRSKDKGGRIVAVRVDVTRVEPGSEEWDRVVPELHAKRLSPPDGEGQPARWARDSVVLRLAPTAQAPERPGHLSSRSHAAPPPDSPATTVGRKPLLVGRPPKPRQAR